MKVKQVGALLTGAAGLLGAGAFWLFRRPLARTRGMCEIPAGLQAPVEVMRDRWGVPHIYARNTRDLMFAQGYVHAQDRLWQLELHRRLVAGRLSELLGESVLDVDRWMRILGMRRVAEQEVDMLSPAARERLAAYADGINARLAQGRLPFEFVFLRCKPEPWTIADTLGWVKMMAWMLSVNWESELLRAQLIARLGPERAAELEPHTAGQRPLIVPPEADYAAVGRSALARANAARSLVGPAASEGLGSNSWVLAGSRTVSGTPLLANDMHLLMNLPAIWYENHLVGDGLNVTGVTFPGIPGVVAGHNEHVAWGFTNGFPDVQDIYFERLRRLDDGRVEYEYQGAWCQAEVIPERIEVRGGEPVIEPVIITRHGPIINSLASDFSGEQPLALRWTALEPDTMIESLAHMNRAQSCLEFREALRGWTTPVQNTVYADSAGNIGYSYPGKIPIRARGDGRVPVPGWTGEYEWTGYIPYDELPHLYNPPQGYIVTANNRVVGPEYPYFIGEDYSAADRARRIIALIEARERIDPKYVGQMHLDRVPPIAATVARFLAALTVDEPDLSSVVAMMGEWDGEMAPDSPAAAVYQLFARRMIYLTLADKLGDLVQRYAGKGPTPVLAEGSLFGQRAFEWLAHTLGQPDSHWFDLGGGEQRDDVMRLALRETVDWLTGALGPDPSKWAWGKIHTLTLSHPLGRIKPLERLLNRGPYPLGGDHSTVWAAGSSLYDLNSDRVVGPPFRFIADLGDLKRALGVLIPGQSGQFGSPHYDDQIDDWFQGRYHPMLFDRQDVTAVAVSVLSLVPAGQKKRGTKGAKRRQSRGGMRGL